MNNPAEQIESFRQFAEEELDGGGLAVNKDGIPQTVWRRGNKVFTAIPEQTEKEIGEGKGCNIETVNNKNIYTWSDDNDNIICMLPDATKKIIGKGSLPLLKSVNDNEVVCVCQQDKEIKSFVIQL